MHAITGLHNMVCVFSSACTPLHAIKCMHVHSHPPHAHTHIQAHSQASHPWSLSPFAPAPLNAAAPNPLVPLLGPPNHTHRFVTCKAPLCAGQGEEATGSPIPRIVRGTREHFVRVAAGANHSLALTGSGQVFSFGDGSFGALGACL